jgi:hypothetical protein
MISDIAKIYLKYKHFSSLFKNMRFIKPKDDFRNSLLLDLWEVIEKAAIKEGAEYLKE